MALSAEEREARRQQRETQRQERAAQRETARSEAATRKAERQAARQQRIADRRAKREGGGEDPTIASSNYLDILGSPTGPFSLGDILNPEWYQPQGGMKPQLQDWRNLLNNYIMAKGHYASLMMNPMSDPSWLNTRDQIDIAAQGSGRQLEQSLLRRGITGGGVASGLTQVENQRLSTLGSTLAGIRANAEEKFYGMAPPTHAQTYYNRTNANANAQQDGGTDWGSLAMGAGMLLGSNAGSNLIGNLFNFGSGGGGTGGGTDWSSLATNFLGGGGGPSIGDTSWFD